MRQGDRTVPAVRGELDLSETAGRPWVAEAAVDTGERDGLTTEERDILKRAATCCAMGTR